MFLFSEDFSVVRAIIVSMLQLGNWGIERLIFKKHCHSRCVWKAFPLVRGFSAGEKLGVSWGSASNMEIYSLVMEQTFSFFLSSLFLSFFLILPPPCSRWGSTPCTGDGTTQLCPLTRDSSAADDPELHSGVGMGSAAIFILCCSKQHKCVWVTGIWMWIGGSFRVLLFMYLFLLCKVIHHKWRDFW